MRLPPYLFAEWSQRVIDLASERLGHPDIADDTSIPARLFPLTPPQRKALRALQRRFVFSRAVSAVVVWSSHISESAPTGRPLRVRSKD
mmetsp:Transcript_10129/g.23717  ORF Transcript_10129/g.23717 Transcript_10129/m.23717 type:complete len:89 (+) Transcript_10129:73-339(+)